MCKSRDPHAFYAKWKSINKLRWSHFERRPGGHVFETTQIEWSPPSPYWFYYHNYIMHLQLHGTGPYNGFYTVIIIIIIAIIVEWDRLLKLIIKMHSTYVWLAEYPTISAPSPPGKANGLCPCIYTWQPTIGLNHAAQRHICRPRATVHLSQLTCRDGLFIFMVLPHLPTYSHCEWLHLATSTWLCAVIIRCGYVVVVFGGWMERSLIIIIIMWSSLCGPVVAV